jgi:hypothetical protein
MGVTGAGKSSFISLLAEDGMQRPQVGHSLKSCLSPSVQLTCLELSHVGTTEPQVYSFKQPGGRRGFLIDTPGFDDTAQSDTEVLRGIASFLCRLYENGRRLTGLIYLHRITDPRMGGSAVKTLEIFQKLCGWETFPSIVLVSTMWQTLGSDAEAQRIGLDRERTLKESEKFWGAMLNSGSLVERHNGDVESAYNIIRLLVSGTKGSHQKPVLDIQREMVDKRMALDETAAGKYLQSEFFKRKWILERQIDKLETLRSEARQDEDIETEESLIAEQSECKTKLKITCRDQERLQVGMSTLESDKNHQYQRRAAQAERQKKLDDNLCLSCAKSIRKIEDELSSRPRDKRDAKIKQLSAEVAALRKELRKAKERSSQHSAFQKFWKVMCNPPELSLYSRKTSTSGRSQGNRGGMFISKSSSWS